MNDARVNDRCDVSTIISITSTFMLFSSAKSNQNCHENLLRTLGTFRYNGMGNNCSDMSQFNKIKLHYWKGIANKFVAVIEICWTSFNWILCEDNSSYSILMRRRSCELVGSMQFWYSRLHFLCRNWLTEGNRIIEIQETMTSAEHSRKILNLSDHSILSIGRKHCYPLHRIFFWKDIANLLYCQFTEMINSSLPCMNCSTIRRF